ncbi:MAG: CsbD family protein [Geminicoccaceae bacterium]|nr:CsbD family protein [Geminicoccaceae bacterium]MCE3249053.1 CsbD family protein [Geminicoccaceae bacterium]
MAGTTDKAKGVMKEAAGKATGDKRIETEGKVDRAKGEVKDAAHQAKESAKGVRDSLKKD